MDGPFVQRPALNPFSPPSDEAAQPLLSVTELVQFPVDPVVQLPPLPSQWILNDPTAVRHNRVAWIISRMVPPPTIKVECTSFPLRPSDYKLLGYRTLLGK